MQAQQQFAEVIQLIKHAQTKAVKSVNIELINLYWNVGAYVTQKLNNAVWGEKTVDELASFIHKNQPELKGFDRRGLYRMKQFYDTYASASFVLPPEAQIQIAENKEIEIVSPVATQFKVMDIRSSILAQINWSHHLIIISRCKTDEEKEFYIRLCIKEMLSKRELDRQISASLFERIALGKAKISSTLKDVHPHIANSIKDSYVFEFLGLPEVHSENELKKGLVGQLKNFILELGKDFLFIGEEYRIQVGNSDFYIDLLFYHRELQCLVAFELKADKFKPEHLGQLNFYLEALDRDVKKANENPSIGILLCKDRDSEVVEYALNRTLSPTMVSKYQMQLPDRKTLQQKLRELFE